MNWCVHICAIYLNKFIKKCIDTVVALTNVCTCPIFDPSQPSFVSYLEITCPIPHHSSPISHHKPKSHLHTNVMSHHKPSHTHKHSLIFPLSSLFLFLSSYAPSTLQQTLRDNYFFFVPIKVFLVRPNSLILSSLI